jgi:hypothetical protein
MQAFMNGSKLGKRDSHDGNDRPLQQMLDAHAENVDANLELAVV